MEWKEEANRIFCNSTEGNLISEATFLKKGNIITVDHVFVDRTYRGQGIAHEAMLEIMTLVEKNDWKLQCTCPYAIAWIEKNGQKYSDFLV